MRKGLCVAISLLVMALLMSGCGHSKGMNSPQELTGEEKARVVEIALNTPQASEWLEAEGEYEIASLGWYAIDDGEWWCLEYEGIENDPNRQLIPESARWYPGVTIRVGEITITQMQIAVDLETEKAVLVEGPYPSLSSPDRFPKPAPKPTSIPPPREAIVMVKSELEGDRHDQGSGFITSSDGHILAFLSGTSMIERLEVVLYDGRTFPAKVINIDPVTELACIKIEVTDLTTLKFAAGMALEIGERLMAVGYSGEEFKTISAKVLDPDYTLSLPKDNIPAVKLDVGGEPGFAGGPVVNMAGEAVGINLAFDPKTGEAYMVSIDYPGVILVMKSCGGTK